jgi:aerobic C4-dicarboxylate transport protein
VQIGFDSVKQQFDNHQMKLYIWVLLAIIIGILIGAFFPEFALQLKFLGDVFIALVKMLIGPVVFCTVVLGICGTGDIKKVGRIGGKALIYFEVVSTFALLIGVTVAHVLKPGSGIKIDPNSLHQDEIQKYVQKAQELGFTDWISHLIPTTFLNSFTGSGDLLQILFVALLFGFALLKSGGKGLPILKFVEAAGDVFFQMINLIMKLAPLGAGGAMAYTVGKYGLGSLKSLAFFMLCFYVSCGFFVFLVLGVIARLSGFSIFKFLSSIKEELLTVLGTSSSESVLVRLMEKLEDFGCSRAVVGVVIPAGYSFNLDGTNIYITLASLFVAQAMGVDLTWSQELSLIGVAMLTSKGASGVTGSGFVTLAATLAVVPSVPVAGLALILGIDRFMSEARAITNTIGNGVATIVISRWENEIDLKKFKVLQ